MVVVLGSIVVGTVLLGIGLRSGRAQRRSCGSDAQTAHLAGVLVEAPRRRGRIDQAQLCAAVGLVGVAVKLSVHGSIMPRWYDKET